MSASTPNRTTYSLALDLLVELHRHVRRTREHERLTMRALAHELGLSHSVIHRIEHGFTVRSDTLEVVLAWLDAVARRDRDVDRARASRDDDTVVGYDRP